MEIDAAYKRAVQLLNENSYTHKVLIDALLKFKTLGELDQEFFHLNFVENFEAIFFLIENHNLEKIVFFSKTNFDCDILKVQILTVPSNIGSVLDDTFETFHDLRKAVMKLNT